MKCIPIFARWGVALAGAVSLVSATSSAVTTAEIEPNDFANPQILSANDSTLNGEITDVLANPPVVMASSLMGAIPFEINSLGDPDDKFIAWIDNDPFLDETRSHPNTILGSFATFDPMEPAISSDDDASPIGDGKASALQGVVHSDGTIRLKVTGFDDSDFTGMHSQVGEFDLLVTLGELDVDFYSYRNLVPGSAFTMDLRNTSAKKTLVWLDDDGNRIDAVFGSFPLCIGIEEEALVPMSGILNFAVTGGQDGNADGFPDTDTQPGDDDVKIGIGTGGYTLVFVPEPNDFALSLTALGVLMALPRRRGAPALERFASTRV